jgi:hypothetical protein
LTNIISLFRRNQCVDDDEDDDDDDDEDEGGDNDDEEEEEVGDVGEVGEQSGVGGPAELSREGNAEESGTPSGADAGGGWPWSEDSERCGMTGVADDDDDDDEPDCGTTCVVDVDRSVPPFSLSFPFSAFLRCFVRIRWLSLTAADAALDSSSHSTLTVPSSRLLV